MDEKMNGHGHGEGCECGMCKGGMGMGSMWGGCGCRHCRGRHLIAKILILLFVFWLGMQFGEIHAYRYGGMMGGWGGYGYPGGMMQGYYDGYEQGYGPGATVPSGSSVAAPSTQ